MEKKDHPVPHFIIDDFLSTSDLTAVWGVLKFFKARCVLGKMISSGKEVKDQRKQNLNTWLTDDNGNPLLEGKLLHFIINRNLVSFSKNPIVTSESLYAGLQYVQKWNMLLSIYEEDGHRYGAHRDASWVTCSLMLQPPNGRGFDGGDFFLYGFDEQKDKACIPFLHNRMIVFPGLALHAAEKITKTVGGFAGSRITIQIFPALY
jgi:hypothetical protein